MVEIRLHGALAMQFGKVWKLDVRSVQEAVQAIEANMSGFRRKIMELSDKGMVFRVRSKTHDYDNADVHTNLGGIDRVDIIPIVAGASAGVRFVIGAILVVVGIITSPYGGSALIPVGLSLMVGSIVEWLTPKPKKEDGPQALQSWAISGPTNTVDQGYPVPVIYGEVLTGGYTISAGIAVAQIANGSIDPSISIGGNRDISDMTGAGGDFVSRVHLGVGVFNAKEPFTYSWSYTGFTGAASVTLIGDGTPAIELDVAFAGVVLDTVVSYSGNVSLTVTGKKADNSGDDVTMTETVPVKVTIDARAYQPAGDGGDGGGGGGL